MSKPFPCGCCGCRECSDVTDTGLTWSWETFAPNEESPINESTTFAGTVEHTWTTPVLSSQLSGLSGTFNWLDAVTEDITSGADVIARLYKKSISLSVTGQTRTYTVVSQAGTTYNRSFTVTFSNFRLLLTLRQELKNNAGRLCRQRWLSSAIAAQMSVSGPFNIRREPSLTWPSRFGSPVNDSEILLWNFTNDTLAGLTAHNNCAVPINGQATDVGMYFRISDTPFMYGRYPVDVSPVIDIARVTH